jgi:hypothetical protein
MHTTAVSAIPVPVAGSLTFCPGPLEVNWFSCGQPE